MIPDDHRTGLGALIAALILSVASLAFVLWIVEVSRGGHTLYATTSFDAPETGADVASRMALRRDSDEQSQLTAIR